MHHTFWYIPSLHWKRPEISSSDDLWRTTNHKTIKKWVRFLTIQPQENSFHYSEIFLAIVPSWSWLQLPITGWRIKSIRLVEATAKRTTKTCNVLQHCCKRNSWFCGFYHPRIMNLYCNISSCCRTPKVIAEIRGLLYFLQQNLYMSRVLPNFPRRTCLQQVT